MQTIYLDISNKGVYPCIVAKQREVGRKFLAVITDNGVPYFVKNDSVVSVWYDGASGRGNYTDVGDKSAISVSANKITIELIEQMLANAGDGVLTVLINSSNGEQIGLWNIEYCVENIAGAESEKAEEYYTAFSKAAGEIAKNQDRIDSLIKSKNATAAGLIYSIASDKVPDGFLLCDGAEYSRNEYSELFDVIGETYGSGNGSTTFNVPNLSKKVLVGSGDGTNYELGKSGGSAEVILTEAQMPSHQHTLTDQPNEQTDWGVKYGNYVGTNPGYGIESNGSFITKPAGGGEAHENMPPYIVVNYIISTGKEIELIVGGTTAVIGGDVAIDDSVVSSSKTWSSQKIDGIVGDAESALDEIIKMQEDIIEDGANIPCGGTTDHNQLTNRDIADQHPMSAITGLEEALANIPTGGGGIEPTEAEKIVDYVVDADSASATEFTFTVAQYPKLAQCNHLRGIYKRTAHVGLPWSALRVNNKQVAKVPTAGYSMVGFDIKSNKDFVYGSIAVPENITMHHSWVNDTMFRGIDRQSLLPLRLGEITTISVFSYTSFLDEGGTIEIWGWND